MSNIRARLRRNHLRSRSVCPCAGPDDAGAARIAVFFKPAPGPKPVTPVNDKQAAQHAQKPPAPRLFHPNENAPAAASGAQVHAASVVDSIIETDVYRHRLHQSGCCGQELGPQEVSRRCG